MLALGNILPEEVKSLADTLVKGLRLNEPLTLLPEKAEAALPEGHTIWSLPSTDEDDPNHAVFVRMQFRESLENDMMLNLFKTALSAKFFDVVRTQQQLGYIVSLGNSLSSKFCYLFAVVQTEYPPDYTRSRIDACLDDLFKFVQDELGEEEFETCRQGLLSDLKMKPKNLGEEMGKFHRSFWMRTYDFDRHDHAIAFLENAESSLDRFKAFTRDKIAVAPRIYNQVNKVLNKQDKELPEGSTTPTDPESLRKWSTHTETVADFAKSAEWCKLNDVVGD